MKFSALPPVRRAVPLNTGDPGARASMQRFFGDRRVTLYASGTAALAQAMINCAARSSVKTPEVVIPAYGCPDLVAACIHASVYPRLVDVARSVWSYDLEALKTALSGNTVAVVAVNLLGLGDCAAELTRICKDRQVPVIQDSAQYLPRESIDWPGDYAVLSFGRGKPLNLLHGGALISPFSNRDPASAPPAHFTAKARLLSSRAAAMAFNTLTRPTIYRIFSALPGTGLGEVIHKPLTNPAQLPACALQRVAGALELYRQRPSYRLDIWTAALAEWPEFGIAALEAPGLPLQREPLRLALLAPDRVTRDDLVGKLNRLGLGASRFYGTELTAVTGVPDVVKHQGSFPNASAMADRLFTLPSHALVTGHTVCAAREVVRSWHRSQKSISTRA